jgi:uncharacterized protein (DUF849 family)
MLHAALNGDPFNEAVPRKPEEIAREARAAVDAGARTLHLHPYDDDGVQTLDAEPCGAAIRAVREACPGVPISLSTAAMIVGDPDRRLALVAAWTELPDLVSANQGEEGVLELCELLWARGVGIEAGLLSVEDAAAFVAAGIAGRCVRALVEPLDPEVDVAVASSEAIDRLLSDAGIGLEQVHHGHGMPSWAVYDRAIARGHSIRAGLEDSAFLPDGQIADSNGQVVAAAAALLAER